MAQADSNHVPDSPEVGLPLTELRLFVPTVVAEWLSGRAAEHFQNRNLYLRSLLVQMYRKSLEQK